MKKIIITIAALAALTTASFAGQRTDVDARDRAMGDINAVGSAFEQGFVGNDVSNNGSAAFAIDDSRSGASLSAFERVTRQSIQNENSRNNN